MPKQSTGAPSFSGVSQASERSRYYNELAGGNIGRLASISDGIFAVGMTLLVLGLAVPAVEAVKTESDLLRQLRDLLPGIVTYFMSFLTLGIFWVAHQTQLSQLSRSNRNFTWIHLAFLLGVTLVPFSTALLARFHWSRVALIVYWLNIFVLGLTLLLAFEYGARAGLFPDEERLMLGRVIRRRIYTAQTLYLVGMLLCFIDTHLSIGVIVAIQLNYAIAPRIPLLHRL
jgi:uncharacterized membrane protein